MFVLAVLNCPETLPLLLFLNSPFLSLELEMKRTVAKGCSGVNYECNSWKTVWEIKIMQDFLVIWIFAVCFLGQFCITNSLKP